MATTLEAIQAKMDKLKAQADALIAKQSSGVIEKIRELMAKHGLTIADIDARTGGKQRATKAVAKTRSNGSAAAVKYRDPKSGATWTGHGRAPGWIASAKNRDKFLVESSAATAESSSAGKVKPAGNYVRGPQPAKYRDPKSGATWSGRGPAPAWLSGAKDRTKFLIDGAGAAVNVSASTETKPSPKKTVTKKTVVKKVAATKTAPTKKVAVKKVVAEKAVSAKVPAKKAPAKKAPRQGVAVPAQVAAIESGAESTT